MNIKIIVITTLLLSQSLHYADSWAIRQLAEGDNIMARIMPLISAITAIPTSALRTTFNLTGGNRASEANSLTSLTSSNTGIGTTGVSTTTLGQSTIGNGGITIIRRGSELLADQIVTALGGAATLMDMLQSYEQNGQIYLGNIQTSVQGLTNRLMNTAYNGANLMIQQLSNQAYSTPGGDFFYRRGGIGGMAITSSSPVTTTRPFILATQTVPQDGFGFPSDINGETLADIGAGRNMITDELNPVSRDGVTASTDGLSSVLVNAASPFGISSENSSVGGTINNPTTDGLPAFFSDFFSAPARVLNTNSASAPSPITANNLAFSR